MGTNLWNGKTLSEFIQTQYGIGLGVRQCQRLFRQLGFRMRKPQPVITRAGPERHRVSIKKLRVIKQNERIDLWALDEVNFQQYGMLCRMWIPPEIKDPVLQHFPDRKSVGYLLMAFH
jgi:hypothetical protein